MKQRIDPPVFTWFLVGALLFSALTFLLGIWVCSHAPRADYGNGEDVPTVVEQPAYSSQENANAGEPESAGEKPVVQAESAETSPPKAAPAPQTVKKTSAVLKKQAKETTPKTTRKKRVVKKAHRRTIKTAPSAPTTIKAERIYYVQLTATVNQKMAEKMKQVYTGKGYNVYLVSARKHGKTLYKVRIGVFKDWKKAKGIAEKIRREDKLKPWIIAM